MNVDILGRDCLSDGGFEECKESDRDKITEDLEELDKKYMIQCIKSKNWDACTRKNCIHSLYYYQKPPIPYQDLWRTDRGDGKDYCTGCALPRTKTKPNKFHQIEACTNGVFGDMTQAYTNDEGGRAGANPMLDEARRRQQQKNPRPQKGKPTPAWTRFMELRREVKKHDTMKKFYNPVDVPQKVAEDMASVFQTIEQGGVVENGVLPKGEMRQAIYVVVLQFVLNNCQTLDNYKKAWVGLTPALDNARFDTSVMEASKILNHAVDPNNSEAAEPINSQRTNCLQEHTVFNTISKEVERVTAFAREFLADHNPSETELRVFTAAYILQKTPAGKRIAKAHGFTTASIDNIVKESDCSLDNPSRLKYLKDKLPGFVKFMKV